MTKPLFSIDKKIDPRSPTALPELIEHVSKMSDTLARLLRNGVSVEDNMTLYYYETTVIDGIPTIIPQRNSNQVLSGAIPIYSSGSKIDSYSVTNSGNSLSVTVNFSTPGLTTSIRLLCFAG